MTPGKSRGGGLGAARAARRDSRGSVGASCIDSGPALRRNGGGRVAGSAMNDVTRFGPQARAKELGPAIAAAADRIEQSRRLTAEIVDALHAARLLRLLLPRSVDGDAVDPRVYIEALEEVSRADGSTGWCMSIHNSTGLIAAYMDVAAAR